MEHKMMLKTLLIGVGLLAGSIANAAGLPWAPNYQNALSQAAKEHKIVMVDFTASWCVNCHKLDRTTYVDPTVVKALGSVVPVHVDYDKERAIAKKFGVEPLPAIVFIDSKQHVIGRIVGYLDAKAFLAKASPMISKGKG